jgi:hypothetical protein
VSSRSADRTSSGIASVAAPALAATVAALPGHSAAGNGDDLTITAAADADDVTAKAPSVSGPHIYGYDLAGNPALTDVGCKCPSGGRPPD